MSVNGVPNGSTEMRNKGNHQPMKCASCNGSGVVVRLSEIPGLEDRRWCSRCKTGEELGRRIEAIINRSGREQTSKVTLNINKSRVWKRHSCPLCRARLKAAAEYESS